MISVSIWHVINNIKISEGEELPAELVQQVLEQRLAHLNQDLGLLVIDEEHLLLTFVQLNERAGT